MRWTVLTLPPLGGLTDLRVGGLAAPTVLMVMALSLSVNVTAPPADRCDQPSGTLTVSPLPGTEYGT